MAQPGATPGRDRTPRVVVAPYDVADCFHMAVEAFNIAEEFQTPVIILSDHPQQPGEVQAEAIFSPQIQETPGADGQNQVVATFAQVLGMQVADLLPQLAEQMTQNVEDGEDGPELNQGT